MTDTENFYYGIWYVGDGKSYDWLCILWKDGDRVMGQFRHRYLTATGEKKSWCDLDKRLRPTDTNESVCADIERLAANIPVVGIASGLFAPGTQFETRSLRVCGGDAALEEALNEATFIQASELEELRSELRRVSGTAEPMGPSGWAAQKRPAVLN